MLIHHDPASALRRDRLRLHADLELRILNYLRERENPGTSAETRYAYLRGQADLICELRRIAISDAADA